MIRLTGIGASEGISLGKALIYTDDKIDLKRIKNNTDVNMIKI